MRLDDVLSTTAENTLRAINQLPETLRSLRDAMRGQPAAQHFEPIRSVRTVLWCWQHEREIDYRNGCTGAKDGEYCTGETITVQDPTGEAAVTNDKARSSHRELSKLINQALTVSERILAICVHEQATNAVNDRAGIGPCTDCHRYADGKKLRLSCYKGGDPICPACRGVRDRLAAKSA